MNNINKKIFGAIIAASVAFGSCEKYLDQQPITSVGPQMVFSDVQSTYAALIGVYSRLTGDQGYGIRLSLYYNMVDTDEMQGPTGAADNDRRDIARYDAKPSNAQLNRPFLQLFQGIEYANICIDNIPSMSLYSNGSEQQKKQLQRMYGEALTLRAQFYYEAIRNWGDLPAQFEPAYKLATSNPYPSRVGQDTLYDRILSDLELAQTLVPWRDELSSIGDAQDERITKGTIKALRARIALARGGYALRQTGGMQRSADYLNYYKIARDECLEIINSGKHSLNPSFKDLWKNQVGAHVSADPNGELMFQVAGIGGGSAGDTKLGYYNGPRAGTYGNSSINPLPSYLYSFAQNDLRRDVTIAPYNINTAGTAKVGLTITALNDGKYRRDWISPAIPPTSQAQYFQTKWQIIRYSDVLLMYAEAENEINGPANAYTAINMVRRRGFGKPINTADPTVDLAGLNKTTFFEAIVRERAFELGGEGIRKYDLIRWNLLGTKLAEAKAEMTAMASASGVYANYAASMYYINTSNADDYTIWANSYYAPAPTSTPAGTTKVNWIGASSITSSAIARFATGYTAGKSELLPIPQPARDANPNLTQNPNY